MSPTLRARLQERQGEITASWQEKIFQSYPPETAEFLLQQDDLFANPVGHMFRQATKRIVKILIESGPEASAPLQELIKIRAVQMFSAAEAVGIIFLLKDVIEDIMKSEMGSNLWGEWAIFQREIDELALQAFNFYIKSREKTFEILINEVKSTYWLLEKAQMVNPWVGSSSDEDTDLSP